MILQQRLLAIILLILTLILPMRLPAQTSRSEGLAKLLQAAVIIQVLRKEEKGLALNEQELRSHVIALLRSNLPKLRIIEIASDQLYLNIELNTVETTKGQKTGILGQISLEVYRPATITATGTPVLATVWNQGVSFLGPLGSVSSQVRESIDPLIIRLANDWRQANP